jgi:hypothetical protein
LVVADVMPSVAAILTVPGTAENQLGDLTPAALCVDSALVEMCR